MKLASLFARYLYQHKQLNLPGIGVFTIDPAVSVPDIGDKNFQDFLQTIRYQQKTISAPDESFIDFIRKETGKIRPLAESDLDSFLSDGKILLNIDKPFHLEGIGTLLKSVSGEYTFTPGEPELRRLEHIADRSEESGKRRPVYKEPGAQPTPGRKLLMAAAVIGGIALVIWGGYSLYNRSAPPPAVAELQPDSLATGVGVDGEKSALLDSVQQIIGATLDKPSGTYKFIIEKTRTRERAFRRYNQLKENLTDIRMETADSVHFTLYFILPATPADTARIRDSLKWWYASKQVLVEPN